MCIRLTCSMQLLILLGGILFLQTNALEKCEKSDANHEYIYRLATKTPYRLVANVANRKIYFEGCVPTKIWMLVRHGTRYPSSADITNFNQRLLEIRNLILQKNQEASDHLRNSDIYALQKWKVKLDPTRSQFLTSEGEDEMLELAERMQIRFPTLFPSVYSNTSYFFKYTASQRTKASAQSFATGLFGRQVINDVWYPTPLKKDPVLRFYKLCSKWKNEIKSNTKTLAERSKFKKSQRMQNVVDSITRILRLDEGSLTADDVRIMYSICAFETAWNRRKTSPWCAVLNPAAFKAMEFLEDLKYYYEDGYGFKLTYQQACPAFNDMLKFFDSKDVYPKSTVYFTHSGTILKMLAHLGLYNDTSPLLHTDFDSDGRNWKVSKIDAFGSNIALVLNRCGNKNSIMALHQEKIVHLPGCDGDLCDLETIRNYYSDSVNCDFDAICSNN